MGNKSINPKELYDGSVFGMSQAVIETETGRLFISGQVDWNQQYEITEKSVEGQLRRALSNLFQVRQTITRNSNREFRALWERIGKDQKWISFSNERCVKQS